MIATTMDLQFAFDHDVIVMLITCTILHTLAFAQYEIAPIAQAGCNSTCGLVDIPFPFGM
ncbi:hypothetical protein Ahy_Scaffold6g107903 isoform B [Arachis hypogaea]|uniref:Uncharacterized protein n=1 Tax=Arachis hypogaea TaxID=3818 RepID=A0A444WNV7_ARAHY|nr:hypothetical protein Ahy_Scaffold6g107903 isoform B [Arachis hypogaea]